MQGVVIHAVTKLNISNTLLTNTAPRTPANTFSSPGEKRSGEFLGLACMGLLLPKSGKDQLDCEVIKYYLALPLQTVKFVHLHLRIRTFYERVFCKIFERF